MGLIRKSLAIGTVGVVNPSSKKQRTAKATQRAAEANARAAAALVRQQAEVARIAQQKADEEHEFRYATDAVYRKYIDDKRAKEEAERAAEQARLVEIARVRREQRQRRNEMLVRGTMRTAAVVAVVIAIPLAAVAVWLPQLAVARLSHREQQQPWLWATLTRPFRR